MEISAGLKKCKKAQVRSRETKRCRSKKIGSRRSRSRRSTSRRSRSPTEYQIEYPLNFFKQFQDTEYDQKYLDEYLNLDTEDDRYDIFLQQHDLYEYLTDLFNGNKTKVEQGVKQYQNFINNYYQYNITTYFVPNKLQNYINNYIISNIDFEDIAYNIIRPSDTKFYPELRFDPESFKMVFTLESTKSFARFKKAYEYVLDFPHEIYLPNMIDSKKLLYGQIFIDQNNVKFVKR